MNQHCFRWTQLQANARFGRASHLQHLASVEMSSGFFEPLGEITWYICETILYKKKKVITIGWKSFHHVNTCHSIYYPRFVQVYLNTMLKARWMHSCWSRHQFMLAFIPEGSTVNILSCFWCQYIRYVEEHWEHIVTVNAKGNLYHVFQIRTPHPSPTPHLPPGVHMTLPLYNLPVYYDTAFVAILESLHVLG